ncbi:hypothetical protein MFRU_001g03870 [Monilinia fructicola]|nr:hypothetical protein MFRU_001g03870 [Monilinia fructicola]
MDRRWSLLLIPFPHLLAGTHTILKQTLVPKTSASSSFRSEGNRHSKSRKRQKKKESKKKLGEIRGFAWGNTEAGAAVRCVLRGVGAGMGAYIPEDGGREFWGSAWGFARLRLAAWPCLHSWGLR